MNEYTYEPAKFFVPTLLITWVSWFGAAYFSHQAGMDSAMFPCMMLGSIAPAIIALYMVFGSRNRRLKKDFISRLNILRIKPAYIPAIFLLMPASILLSIAVSLLFGHSADQFRLSSEFGLMSAEAMLGLLISVLAPTSEEFGWRGYGVDSLRSKFSLLKTSVVFVLLWAVWHVPLFFVKDSYQNELWQLGIPYVLNFFISIIPLAFILNWVYYKSNRNIWAAVLFHIMAVVSAEAFSVLESTKFIQTAILLIVTAGIMLYDRAFSAASSEPAPFGC